MELPAVARRTAHNEGGNDFTEIDAGVRLYVCSRAGKETWSEKLVYSGHALFAMAADIYLGAVLLDASSQCRCSSRRISFDVHPTDESCSQLAPVDRWG